MIVLRRDAGSNVNLRPEAHKQVVSPAARESRGPRSPTTPELTSSSSFIVQFLAV